MKQGSSNFDLERRNGSKNGVGCVIGSWARIVVST